MNKILQTNTSERKDASLLTVLILFIASVGLRSMLGIFNGEFYVFYDELIHYKMAYNLSSGAGFVFRGLAKSKEDFLYYLLLSPIFRFLDSAYYRQGMVILNAVMMSSVIFPFAILTQKCIRHKLLCFVIFVMCLSLPEMCYTQQALQENVFFPLSMFLFLFYFEQQRALEDYDYRRSIVCC